MKFKDKIGIVTGCTTGIGLATCNELSQQGTTVYNLDISVPDSNNYSFIPCDISSYRKVKNPLIR